MRNLFRLLVALFTCSSICFACEGGGDYESISAQKLDSLLNAEDIQLLDVRTAVEYSEGRLEGALNINVMDDSFSSHVDSILQTGIPVAVYCRTGNRSKKAAAILVEKGFKVYELDKGIKAWQKAGMHVEK